MFNQLGIGGVVEAKTLEPQGTEDHLARESFLGGSFGKAACRIDHMMSSMSFLEMQVAIRGYSMVFMMVDVTKHHTLVGLMHLVWTVSAHFLALALREQTSSCIEPWGQDQIPKSLWLQ